MSPPASLPSQAGTGSVALPDGDKGQLPLHSLLSRMEGATLLCFCLHHACAAVPITSPPQTIPESQGGFIRFIPKPLPHPPLLSLYSLDVRLWSTQRTYLAQETGGQVLEIKQEEEPQKS